MCYLPIMVLQKKAPDKTKTKPKQNKKQTNKKQPTKKKTQQKTPNKNKQKNKARKPQPTQNSFMLLNHEWCFHEEISYEWQLSNFSTQKFFMSHRVKILFMFNSAFCLN